jgi:hypothetical protein
MTNAGRASVSFPWISANAGRASMGFPSFAANAGWASVGFPPFAKNTPTLSWAFRRLPRIRERFRRLSVVRREPADASVRFFVVAGEQGT